MSDILTVQPLTRQAFAPYGDVLEMEGAEIKLINGGTTERFHALSQAEIRGDGKAGISIFRGQPRRFPYAVEMMERHPLGSQSFYPLSERPWLVIVADDDNGRPGRPKVFSATGLQGVNYRPNIWHHPLMALCEPTSFIVVDRVGSGINLEESTYPSAYRIAPQEQT